MPGRFNLADYEDVKDRIAKFWTENPNGAIHTSLVSDPETFERVVFMAQVYKQRPNSYPAPADATGYAAEEKGTGGANTTSWHENAETSAIGRALANMGYATSKNRPSLQEMQKVERMEASEAATYDPPPPKPIAPGERVPGGASKKQVNFIRALAGEAGMDGIELHEFMVGETGKESSNHLTSGDATKLIEKLQALANNPRN